MSMKVFPSRSIASLAIIFALLSIQPGSAVIPYDQIMVGRDGSCYVEEDLSEVRIGNDLVELSFRKDVKGGLDRVLDKTTGIDLRADKEVAPIIYALFYDPGTGIDAALQWDAQTVLYRYSVSSSGCELFINSSSIKGLPLNTSVRIRLEDGSSLFRMRLDVECGNDIIFKYAFFPLVWGIGQIGASQFDDISFFPVGDGLSLKDPLSDIDTLYLSDTYPAGASMQFMCHFDPKETGLYIATYDPDGTPKKLNMVSLNWAGKQKYASYFQLFPPEAPGNGLGMNYDAVLGTFHGDLYDAADIYSGWAMTTPFVSGGTVGDDKDTPSWWLDTSILGIPNRDRETVHNTLPAIVNMTGEMSDLTGLDTTALIFAWEKEGGWVGPNFFPPAEGENEFISAMEDLKENGDHGFVYMSGTVWRITRDDIGYSNWSYFNSTGKPWAATKENGEVLMDENYATIGWQCARMCPYTQFWHDMVVNNFLELIRLGVDVVQLDEFPIGTMYPCYNASHGHLVGHSSEMSEALMSILDECRSLGRAANPNLIMSAEEPCELYLPYLDTYVSRDNAEEYMLYPWMKQQFGDRAQFVPAFGYVYHSYITSFGEPLYLGKDYPEQLNGHIKRGLARSLVQGEIISGGGEAQEDIWPALLQLYDRTARAASTFADDYVVKGKMLRPPTIDVPTEQVQWYFGSIGKFGNPFNESSVVNGAWMSPAGEIGHILVNWVETSVEFDLAIEPYDLGPSNVSVIGTVNMKREVINRSVTLPTSIHLKMDPNDVVLIEVVRAPDITVEIDDIGQVLTNDTIYVDLVFENGGSVPTGPFYAEVSMDGSGIGALDVSSIIPGSSSRVRFLLDTSGILGGHTLEVEVDPEGLVRELYESNNLATMTLEVMDRPRSDIHVLVLDNRSSGPIEGCNVSLTHADLTSSITSLLTDGSGMVSFTSVIAGPYHILVNRSGYEDRSLDLDLPEGVEKDVTIRMDPFPVSYALKGTVTDNSTGEPLEGVELTLSLKGAVSAPVLALTDALGTFHFTGLSEGDQILRTFKEGFINRTIELVIPFGPGTIGIILDRVIPVITTGTLRGTVHDQDGVPIVGAIVSLRPSGPIFTTGDSGEYLLQGLQPGNYSLNVTAFGFLPYETPIEITAGAVLFRNVTLDPVPQVVLGSISGLIRDHEGNPIQGARLSIEMNVTIATSDGNGYYLIEDLGPGTYDLTVRSDGFIPKVVKDIVVDGSSVTVDITLEPLPTKHPDVDDEEGANIFLLALVMVPLLAVIAVLVILLIRKRSGPDVRTEE